MKSTNLLKPHPVIVPLIRAVVLRVLKRRYHLEGEEDEGVKNLKPPFLVVANHVNFWDPFWINTFITAPIQFVASDNLFRTPLFGLAMRLMGAIPKTKLMNDSRTIAHIFRVINAGGVVGIFPEGTRSYDGRSEPAQLAVARLVRKLKVPVVSALIQGGYLARPRWAKNVRLGSVRVRYRLLFSGQDLADRGVGEVYRSLSEAVSFDEMAVQRKRLISFPTMAPAEYLERLLFVCPQCHSLGSLFSRGHRFWCTLCGYAVRVNTLGFLVRDAGPLRFDDPADWNAWQLGVFRDYLLKHSHPWTPKLAGKERARSSRLSLSQASGHGPRPVILLKDRIEVHERSGVFFVLTCPPCRAPMCKTRKSWSSTRMVSSTALIFRIRVLSRRWGRRRSKYSRSRIPPSIGTQHPYKERPRPMRSLPERSGPCIAENPQLPLTQTEPKS